MNFKSAAINDKFYGFKAKGYLFFYPCSLDPNPCFSWSHRLVVQDAGLSSRKHGFETRWDRQLFCKFMGIILYIIEGIAKRKRYVGITNNLQRRLQEHRNKYTKGGQITGDFKLNLY